MSNNSELSIIVLAGGLGTRIRETIGDIPKILAPISNKLFIDYFLEWIYPLASLNKTNLIFSLFYKSNLVIDYLHENLPDALFIVDKNTYGTFGAVGNAVINYPSKNYLILNGDTIFLNNFKKNYKEFLKDPQMPLLLLREADENLRYGGYKRFNEKWLFSKEKSEAISMGAFFISYKEILRRWKICTEKELSPSNFELLCNRKLMNDNDCLSLEPVNGILLKEDTPFIDIGIRASYFEAQNFIPSIIK